MRVPYARASSALAILLVASSASAVSMAWTPVGNPGNACDPKNGIFTGVPICKGAVGYSYQIGTYEVTNAQYAEFLNAKAASDPYGLFNPGRMDDADGWGGITRSGSSGSYTYATIAGRENRPVNFVSFFDAVRFAG